MSNGHTAADAIDAPPSGEGCVSVLDYADGQAKAFRTGQQNAAAQEAVAWSKTKPTVEGAYYLRGFNLFQPVQYEALVQVRTHHFDGEPAPELVCNIHESTSNADMDDWSPMVDMSDDFEWFGPLAAAPVAAAPVDLDAHGLRALDNCIADVRRLLELAQDYDLDVMQMQSLEAAIESMELRKRTSTPAAPGIDLTPIKLLVLAWRHMEGGNGSMASQNRKDAFRRCANELEKALKLIDASPKGGSDAEPMFYIQDTRGFVGNCPVWWGPNGNGYVTRLDEAGRFTEQEAIAQNRTRDTDVPWPCTEIDKLGRITVDVQHMRPRRERLAELQATSAEVGA